MSLRLIYRPRHRLAYEWNQRPSGQLMNPTGGRTSTPSSCHVCAWLDLTPTISVHTRRIDPIELCCEPAFRSTNARCRPWTVRPRPLLVLLHAHTVVDAAGAESVISFRLRDRPIRRPRTRFARGIQSLGQSVGQKIHRVADRTEHPASCACMTPLRTVQRTEAPTV